MHLIYYSHSYRPADNDLNEFVQDLMLGERLTPSLDPPSDRLNSAKPERHLKSTDALVAVVPYRDTGPSRYILYEIALAARANMPALIFVEDVLPDDLISSRLLQRRFSRRHLLRQVRTHKHAFASLRDYCGSEPPPAYQPSQAQRSCLLLGLRALSGLTAATLSERIKALHYNTMAVDLEGYRVWHSPGVEAVVTDASVAVVVLDQLSESESYLLGIARGALVPTILLTCNQLYEFSDSIPREYQPRILNASDPEAAWHVVSTELSIFEEDYLDVTDQGAVQRYRQALITTSDQPGDYSREARETIVNVVAGKVELDMSKDKIHVDHVVGPVNIKSRLDQVTQTVTQGSLKETDRDALNALVAELQSALAAVSAERRDDAERIAASAATVATEVVKAKPNKGFLNISLSGLKEAAKAVEDIAPSVLSVAAKLAAFVAGLI